jgi:TonB family protein
MMLTLLESNRTPLVRGQGVLVSAIVHSALIGAVVVGHRDPVAEEKHPLEEKVVFIIPVDRSPESRPQQAEISWVGEGQGAGESAGDEGMDAKDEERASELEVAVAGRTPNETESTFTPPSDDWSLGDTVLTVLEVDSAVARSPESAAPAYPETMLAQNIEGVVNVQYVVDTLGLVDTNTVKILESTHPDFTQAVRIALPGMRFRPAIVRSRKVRQLVQQPFTFRIQPPSAALSDQQASATKKPPLE